MDQKRPKPISMFTERLLDAGIRIPAGTEESINMHPNMTEQTIAQRHVTRLTTASAQDTSEPRHTLQPQAQTAGRPAQRRTSGSHKSPPEKKKSGMLLRILIVGLTLLLILLIIVLCALIQRDNDYVETTTEMTTTVSGEIQVETLLHNGILCIAPESICANFDLSCDSVSDEREHLTVFMTGTDGKEYSLLFESGSDAVILNGKETYRMPGEAVLYDNVLHVEAAFLNSVFNGLVIDGNTVKKTADDILLDLHALDEYSVAVTEVSDTQTSAPETSAPETSAPETSAPETSAPETSAPETTEPARPEDIPDITYNIDITPYYNSIQLAEPDSYLYLINRKYQLQKNYSAGEMTEVLGSRQRMEATAAIAMAAMAASAKADGFTLIAKSGYRSYSTQNSTYLSWVAREEGTITKDAVNYFGTAYINETYTSKGLTSLSHEDALKVASTYSALPGQSEHQSGLALDINSTSQSFADTPEAKWLAENSWKFGFILRYTKEDTETTGYIYEPWHFRFVGLYHAWRMHENGLCLEDYIDLLIRENYFDSYGGYEAYVSSFSFYQSVPFAGIETTGNETVKEQ